MFIFVRPTHPFKIYILFFVEDISQKEVQIKQLIFSPCPYPHPSKSEQWSLFGGPPTPKKTMVSFIFFPSAASPNVCSVNIFVHASVSSLDVVATASANDRCVEGPLHIAPVWDPLIQSVILQYSLGSNDPVCDPAIQPVIQSVEEQCVTKQLTHRLSMPRRGEAPVKKVGAENRFVKMCRKIQKLDL